MIGFALEPSLSCRETVDLTQGLCLITKCFSLGSIDEEMAGEEPPVRIKASFP